MAKIQTCVILGADTHKHTHTIALVDKTGRELGTKTFDVCANGYRQALVWARSFGVVLRAGIESTGSYGAGLCAHLKDAGVTVYDVYAPDRPRRRREGKDDMKDAYQAAQAALSLTRCAPAKDKDASIEAALGLENAHRLAIRQRSATINALKAAIIKLDDEMRSKLESKTNADIVKSCAAFRVPPADKDIAAGTKLALRHYARQIQHLSKEIAVLDKEIAHCAQALVPHALELYGLGAHGAITLLGAAGANVNRLKNDAAFSMLCGVSPVPASSGDSIHMRLNRGGNRKANCALHIMAIVRVRLCGKTRAFIDKKISEGKSKKDAVRALKRYLAREVLRALKADLDMLGVTA